MADPVSPPTPSVGPFSSTRVTSFKVAPIDISITVKVDSTHVPPAEPAPCGCDDAEPDYGNVANMLVQMFAQMKAQASNPGPTSAPLPTDG